MINVPAGSDQPAAPVYAGMTGNHRPQGVFFSSELVAAENLSLLDIAPTVCAHLGLDAPHVQGRAMAEAEPVAAPQPYTAEQEAAVESRLRDLGYFE